MQHSLNFTLRPFVHDDLPSLVKHANDPTIAAFLSDAFPHPYTDDAGRAFLEEAINKDLPMRRCIDVNGQCCGAIGLHPKPDLWRCNLELGYWLGKPYRGQGIMTEAIRQMVRLGFSTFPDIKRIYASTFVANVASQRVLEKAGLVREAELKGTIVKNGTVHDELIYAVRR